jgi:hypothetical protein
MKRSWIKRKTPMRSARQEGPTADREQAPDCTREPRPMARHPRTPRGTYTGAITGPAPKAAAPVRDEAYRRWVASLPCFECRIAGYSNAAHPNTGKAKGAKLSDAACFPLCVDRPGVVGCHRKFDTYILVPRAGMPEYESRALEWTRQQRAAA